MPGNEVAPLSPQEFNARRNDDSYLVTYQYTNSAKARSTADRIAYSLSTEGAEYSKNNPPFIYPGPSSHAAVPNKPINVKRGYIRRLTEFYARLQQNTTQTDNPSTLQNLRCNFQFNPSSITRSMQANYDMQFFFNQEPSQLAQPIPGQAGFAFELLFNREAEIHSGSYIGPDGKLQKAKSSDNRLSSNPEFFINNTYDPSWVTEIGVLADIMILDDIVGQGLAKDVLENIKNNSITLTQKKSSTSTADDGDKADADSTSTWDSGRLREFSANLGNKAFLTPTPVRVMFSPWFMVEGFVMSYQVTFNKFTPNMIPTQAVVAVQMQALYVGFAQEKTFLTEMPPVSDSSSSGSPDIPAAGTPERDIYDQTAAGLKYYLNSVAHIQGDDGALDLMDLVFANPQLKKEINFIALVSDNGRNFYENGAAKEKNGGGLTFTVEGEIKIWWSSYVNNASNPRAPQEQDATTSGPALYSVGVPPNQSGFDFSVYGTSASPLILKLDPIDVYYDQGKRKGNVDESFDLMVLGQIRFGNDMRLVKGKYGAPGKWGVTAGLAKDAGTPAIWTWNIPKARPIPYRQDKFNVQLELTITAKRFNDDTYTIELPQKVRGSWIAMQADDQSIDDQLFNNLTLSSTAPLTPRLISGGPQ